MKISSCPTESDPRDKVADFVSKKDIPSIAGFRLDGLEFLKDLVIEEIRKQEPDSRMIILDRDYVSDNGIDFVRDLKKNMESVMTEGGRVNWIVVQDVSVMDWQTALDHLAQAKALLEEPGSLDPDFKQMIQQEISEKSQDVAKLENNLKILLLPKDVNDGKNVIMEIRGGAGGEEAALFAHSLLRMYTMYAQNRGWTLELLNLNETELGGVKEAIVSVDGAGAYNRLKYESGVHRVQRVPETETQGRIHTSTATVAVMPQAEEVDFALDMKDLRIDTFRSSGAGGQHINKTSSAIRVTHIPTGTVVECQNERSQFQNKDKALEILRSRLLAQKQKEQQDAINAQRQGQVGTGDRSEKIRTYNFPQDRCTDHRIGLTVHNLEKIMDGNLDEVIDALATREQAEKLQKLGG